MKKILILAGGYSKEREISLKTAKSVFLELLNEKKYKIKIIEPNGYLIKNLRKFKPEVVLNLLHGRYGEDGYIQALLESEKVKYSHSGVLSSALAMDKDLSKKIFIKNKILTPKYIKYSFTEKIDKIKLLNKIKKKLGFPIVIKPLNEGSSVNVYICTEKNIFHYLEKVKEYGEVLLEKFIQLRGLSLEISLSLFLVFA